MTLDGYKYPNWGTVCGWLVTCSSIIPIPIYFVYRFIRSKGSCREVCIGPERVVARVYSYRLVPCIDGCIIMPSYTARQWS